MFRYTFPSDPQYIPGIVHVVSLLAMEFGFSLADYTMNLPLALDEAVSNAIIHGNRRDVRKNVEVEGQIDAQLVRLKVRDEGKGFRRESTPRPAATGEPLGPQRSRAAAHRIGDGRGALHPGGALHRDAQASAFGRRGFRLTSRHSSVHFSLAISPRMESICPRMRAF